MIAYLTSVYARASDTFIRNEVAALRKHGIQVRTFSIRRERCDAPACEDVRLAQDSTTYLLEKGATQLAITWLVELLRNPLRMGRAFYLAQQSASRGIRGRIWAFLYLVEAAALARELRAGSISHLHNHIGENSAAVAMLASELAGITFSLTIHGPGEFDRPLDLALGLKISRAAFTIAISEFGRGQLLRWTRPQDWHKVHIVRCGVEGSLLNAPDAPLPSEHNLVCVARLCEQKGLAILLESLESVRRSFPDVSLTLVGDGPLRPMLEQRVKELGLEGNVHFAGSCGKREVRKFIEAARIMVLPSLAEGLPVVFMEAFALGRPVISTNIAGIPELIEPARNGWLAPAGSMAKLTSAMIEALSCSDEQLARMGSLGKAAVRERHDLSAETRKLADLFVRIEKMNGRPVVTDASA